MPGKRVQDIDCYRYREAQAASRRKNPGHCKRAVGARSCGITDPPHILSAFRCDTVTSFAPKGALYLCSIRYTTAARTYGALAVAWILAPLRGLCFALWHLIFYRTPMIYYINPNRYSSAWAALISPRLSQSLNKRLVLCCKVTYFSAKQCFIV